LGDPDTVDKAIRGTEVIYHLGAALRGTTVEFDRGTIVGTRNVVESALRHHVGKLIYISSLSVLKSHPSQVTPLTEESELEPFPAMRGNYTRTKCAAEQYVLEAARLRGLPAVIIRPAEVMGAGAQVITSGIAQRRRKRLIILGDGRLPVPMVHIEDLIDGILLAQQSDGCDGSIFHFVDHVELNQNEVIEAYNRRQGAQFRILHIPRVFFYTSAVILQAIFFLMRRSSPLTVYRLQSALAKRRFDCTLARCKLGWQPVRGVRAALAEAMGNTSAQTPTDGGVGNVLVNAAPACGESNTSLSSSQNVVAEAIPDRSKRYTGLTLG
jgi:nucleoside-diphosphate-sugar epimerase